MKKINRIVLGLVLLAATPSDCAIGSEKQKLLNHLLARN